MTWVADAGLWLAVVFAGALAGMLASRWRRAAPALRVTEGLLLSAAAAAVISWCGNAGALLGASQGTLLVAHVSIDVAPGLRLGVLWATLPGAALTCGTILLVWSAISGTVRADQRLLCLTVSASVVALGIAAWFAPQPGSVASSIPPFVQSAWALLAPLFALLAVLGVAVLLLFAVARHPWRHDLLVGTWMASTAAVACEQVARSQLGIGPRDGIVLGAASSGLVLWLVTGALLHRRVQALLRQPTPAAMNRLSAIAGHVGALLLALSFGLHAFARRATVDLPPGAVITVTDAFSQPWQLANQGVSRFDAEGVDVTAVAIEARDPRGKTALLTPEIRDYHTRDGQHLATPVVLRKSTGGAAQAMRLLVSEPDSLDATRVRVTFLPAPILWPVGVALLLLSGLLALTGSPATNRPPSPE